MTIEYPAARDDTGGEYAFLRAAAEETLRKKRDRNGLGKAGRNTPKLNSRFHAAKLYLETTVHDRGNVPVWFRRIYVLLRALKYKESEDKGMGAYAIGILTGIVMCMVAMLVRCVVWYGKKHPEDDYWHRIPPEEERNEGSG